ncbi:MAG: poly(3-hydroxybutyrate) depolymerase/transglutaminase-like putative cysteine protease [Planctomycetota bacterium]|jgi:poly(3-hydroxybutyrate) depolymerase/transglutaminase-like putative cysteine protease
MNRFFLLLLLVCGMITGAHAQATYEEALVRSGDNRGALEQAVEAVPEDEREAMCWLIAHMPAEDLRTLATEFLVRNHTLAFSAWRQAPWQAAIDTEHFLDGVLPYASVDETRDAWRAPLQERCLPMVAEAKTASEAAAILNNAIWKEFNVKYSTKRNKANQSPFETMDLGLASCTGLSVLLIDACRSVGVAARFAGTPRWSDDSGNHSWVEIWDDGWHYTGAAEPNGMDLDRGWFGARAATAQRDEAQHAIYAVSWKTTPTPFLLAWSPDDKSVSAVNVTDRYTTESEKLEEGQVRVRFRAVDSGSDARVVAKVSVLLDTEKIGSGHTRDERFDSNDHLELRLQKGEEYTCSFKWRGRTSTLAFFATDELLVTAGDAGASPWAVSALSSKEARTVIEEQWDDYQAKELSAAASRIDAGVLEDGDLSLPFWFKVFGEEPVGGHSLFISMHGGGSVTQKLNDGQWENQKKLYTLEEGIYLVPRAPTNTWNLWHQGHIDGFFDQLIRDMVVSKGVNPDRVYLTGYSAGGDGVYQLAPRMADRFAAAGMMAGHPNETNPDGLRNLAFALHVGGDDAAYDRNRIAGEWKILLDELAREDPGGYEHQVEVHAGKPHWMDREEAAALPWMAGFARDLRPNRIVWLQDDVLHQRFYWLRNGSPAARERIVAEREGQEITILEAPSGCSLEVLLDDSMCDLDQEVLVLFESQELYRGIPDRSFDCIERTLLERGDPSGIFSCVIEVAIPAK